MNKSLSLSLVLSLAGACGDDDGMTMADTGPADMQVADNTTGDDTGTPDAMDTPDGAMPPPVYAFESQFEAGESSVAYGGQTNRHVLIDDLTSFIIGLGDAIDAERPGTQSEAEILDSLNRRFFRYDEEFAGEDILISTPDLLQETYGDLGTANIFGKVAGNDDARMHRDWNAVDGDGNGPFEGWNSAPDGVDNSPTGYVDWMLGEIARLGGLHAEGVTRMGPDGVELPPTVTDEGLDLRQLLQKFLLGAVAFSQGADDYLDEGFEGPNTQREGTPYSELEHAWDEGFGYYGAARDAILYTDDEAASKGGRDDWQGAHDTDGDGRIDLRSERFFGAAVNAAKRDRGSTTGTDISTETYLAFFEGRAIIASGATDPGALGRLETVRDAAILGWERAIAATAIHYVNVTIADMENVGTDDFNFLDLAKHWGELKGFAFSFQFNPRSPMLDDFAMLHTLIGEVPVFDADGVADATTNLLAARDLMAAAYGFADADVENW